MSLWSAVAKPPLSSRFKSGGFAAAVQSVVLLLLLACGRDAPGKIVPWAWERREDLRAIDVEEVAYLAATITLRGDAIDIHPRMQPLRIARATRAIPVVRIEAKHASLTDAQLQSTVNAIVRTSSRSNELQIDFDAVQSQRPFYGSLLRALRARLPRTRIVITALASWCMDDRWLAGLPFDDAIPMLFRMADDDRAVRASLMRGDDFREPRCRSSLGMALDEPLARAPRGRKVYVFATHAWTERDFDAAKELVKRWNLSDRSSSSPRF
jgi:hypothetical protein